jgi:GNAT superfamily N-acetyltransferase
MKNYRISTEKKVLDIEMIHRFLSEESYWAKGRSFESVKRSIDNSFCFAGFIEEKQISFARVITDFVAIGWIADVFVLPDYRGYGYGKELMKAVISEPRMQELNNLILSTDDAHSLYTPFGFLPPERPENLLFCPISKIKREKDLTGAFTGTSR